MIVFKILRYKNFLSSGNIFTEIKLDESQTTLIIGKNGSGKSTAIDALSFVLFNKAYRNINKPQLVNSITKKNCLVEIEFSVNNKQYKVVRGIEPAVFEIYENGKLLGQTSENRDYQKYLEKYILKTNHKTFCQVVILGTASYVPFMALPAAGRREIVENLLDLNIFSIMNVLNKNKLQSIEYKIQENNTEKRLLKQRIDLVKEHQNELVSNNQKIIEDKEERIKGARDKIYLLKHDHVENSALIQGLQKKITDQNKQNELVRKYSQFKIKLETKISNLTKSVDFFKGNESCPTCSQNIDKEFKEKIISHKEHVCLETTRGLEKLQEKLDACIERQKAITRVGNEIAELSFKNVQIDNDIQHQEDYIKELEQEIEKLQKPVKKTDIKDLVQEKDVLEEKHKQLVEQKNIYEYINVLLKDSGIKARIIKQYVPIINKLINKYLSMFDFFVNFTMNEQFEEQILSRFRDDFSYESFSEGEKFRINLAILFTWRAVAKLRNSINTNILIMDETLDSSLDVDGIEEFMKIIKQVSDETNIFIISHRIDQLSDKFNNTIKFEKRQNFSTIAKG